MQGTQVWSLVQELRSQIPGWGAKIPQATGRLSTCITTTDPVWHSKSPCNSAKIPHVAAKTWHSQKEKRCVERSPRHSFPGGSAVKKLPANAGDEGDVGSIPGSGRSPGGGNGHPLQYSCLKNPMDRRAWPATVHWVTKSQTQLSTHMYVNYTSIKLEEKNIFLSSRQKGQQIQRPWDKKELKMFEKPKMLCPHTFLLKHPALLLHIQLMIPF